MKKGLTFVLTLAMCMSLFVIMPKRAEAAGTFNVTDPHLRDYYQARWDDPSDNIWDEANHPSHTDEWRTQWRADNSNVATPNDNIDDQLGIQAAIDACNRAGGGTVVFSPGTYYIDDSIVVRGGVTLDASGATIIRRNIDKPMVRNYIGAVATEMKNKGYEYSGTTEGGYAFNSNNITIKGGTWDGNVTNDNQTDNQDLFRLYCLKNVKIQNCTLKNVCGDHHIDLGNVNGATISGVKFSGHWKDKD